MKLLEKHFEIALETPDGITRLRELILKLAMQAKLIMQDFSVKTGKELLNEIELEKKELIKNGLIKKQPVLSKINKDEVPYQLPKNWEWCRIKDISYDLGQKSPDKTFTYIDVSSIDNNVGKVSSNFQVLEYNEAPSRARKIVKKGTVIYSTVRPYLLNIAIITEDYNNEPIASTAFAILHPYSKIHSKFIYFYLRSSIFTKYVELHMKGIAYPAINDKNFYSGYFPLPPFEEQKRIVEKIDQLMLLCDKLEAERDRKNKLQLQINSAAINNLIKANDETSFNIAWRFIANQFDTLYTVKQNVTDLREVILNLAMRGKLVVQDSEEQSAFELHKEIITERNKLIKDGIIRKQKELLNIKEDEITYQLPKNWKWVRLNDFGTWKSGSTPNRSNSSFYEGKIPWVKSGEVKQGKIKYTSETITEYALEKCSLQINPIGSVLIAMYGANIGEAGVLEIEAATNQAVCACNTFKGIDNYYLYNLILSLKSNFISQGAGAAQPNISREKIINTVVPLPPYDEQKRIVKRINQLFELCDKLEENIKQSSKKQSQILNAVLAQV